MDCNAASAARRSVTSNADVSALRPRSRILSAATFSRVCVSAIEYDGRTDLCQCLGHGETEAARCTGDKRHSFVAVKIAGHGLCVPKN